MESSFAIAINIRQLDQYAVEAYRQCPKHITIIRHADREDDSKFHCLPMATKSVPMVRLDPIDFIVPGQVVIMVEDSDFGLFTIIRVTEQEDGPQFALVTSVRNRMGFLIPFNKVPGHLLQMEILV